MKKIIKPGVAEESETLCDATGQPAVAHLVMTFGFGSRRDMSVVLLDLADEVAEEIVASLKARYPDLQYEEEASVMECPLCKRR